MTEAVPARTTKQHTWPCLTSPASVSVPHAEITVWQYYIALCFYKDFYQFQSPYYLGLNWICYVGAGGPGVQYAPPGRKYLKNNP